MRESAAPSHPAASQARRAGSLPRHLRDNHVSAHNVNQISGYRNAYNYLTDLTAADITSTTRLIAGLAGFSGFLGFGYLAWKSLPRPYLARTDLRLRDDERGVTNMAPRAIERAVEGAALDRDPVQHAAARYGGGEVTVNVSVTRAQELAETLRAVRADAHDPVSSERNEGSSHDYTKVLCRRIGFRVHSSLDCVWSWRRGPLPGWRRRLLSRRELLGRGP